jgi:hypothetical protein
VHERHEHAEPLARVAMLALELPAQLLERAREARLDGRDRHTRPARDRARREVLDVAQQHCRAVRLVKRQDSGDQRAVSLSALDELGGRGQRLAARGRTLARGTARFAARKPPREPAHGGREPARARVGVDRSVLPGCDRTQLRGILCERRIAEHVPRQAPDPGGLGQLFVGARRVRLQGRCSIAACARAERIDVRDSRFRSQGGRYVVVRAA